MSACKLCFDSGIVEIDYYPEPCGVEGAPPCEYDSFSVPCPKCAPGKRVPYKISLGLINWFNIDQDAIEPYYNLPPGTAAAWEQFMLDAIERTVTEVMVPENLAYVLDSITDDDSDRW